MKRIFARENLKRNLLIAVGVIPSLFIVLVLARIPHAYEKQLTEEAVAKIHATKLTMADVTGENLPPVPDQKLNDSTIEGIDANHNGIRDDVELAIFKEYPNSAKTRAVLLQYALALQMSFSQPIIDTDTVTEVVREQSRAYACVGEILSRHDMQRYIQEGSSLRSFVEKRQINTLGRENAEKDFLKNISSYSESENEVCDIDRLALTN